MKELILLTVSFFQTLLNVFIFMGHLSGYFPTQDFLENLEAYLKALFCFALNDNKSLYQQLLQKLLASPP